MRIQNHCIIGGETEAWRGKEVAPNTRWVLTEVQRSGMAGEERREGREEKLGGEGRRREVRKVRGKRAGSWAGLTWQTESQGTRDPIVSTPSWTSFRLLELREGTRRQPASLGPREKLLWKQQRRRCSVMQHLSSLQSGPGPPGTLAALGTFSLEKVPT